MSYNRLKYDNCAYDLQMNRSTNPGNYRLYGAYAENEKQCFSSFGPVGSKADVSLVKKLNDLSFSDMADVESELSLRNNKLIKCNDNKFKEFNVNNKCDCDNLLSQQDTRFTHPLDNYRSMSLLEYQYKPYLHINPQCYIQNTYDLVGLNSRLYSKDMYILEYDKPWDKNEALPKPIITEPKCKLQKDIKCNEILPELLPVNTFHKINDY